MPVVIPEIGGGLIGYNVEDNQYNTTSTISNCYCSTNVTLINTNVVIEGFGVDFDEFDEDVVNSYFNSDVNTVYSSESEPYDRTTEELKHQSTFVNWDFNDIWSIDEGNSMPTLQPQQVGKAEVLQPLIASFKVNINGLDVTFTDISTGNPDSYLWDFGDNITSTEQNPTHTYTSAGAYVVKLTVSKGDISNSYSQSIRLVDISKPVPNTPPSAEIHSTYRIGTIPLTVVFSTTSIGTYLWDFGDGIISTEQNPIHTFTKTGSYKVSLIVTDMNGLSSTSYITVVVLSSNINLSLYRTLEVQTSLNYTLDVAGIKQSTSYLINTYTNIIGDVKTIDATNTKVPPIADIIADKLYGFKPLSISFSADTKTPDVFYNWDFGDGETSDKSNPVHNYNKAGIYTIKLTVRNIYGETSSSVQIIVMGWTGKYNLHLTNYDYYYVLDREGNFVYIFDYETSGLISKFGGKGSNFGEFNMPTTLVVSKPIFK